MKVKFAVELPLMQGDAAFIAILEAAEHVFDGVAQDKAQVLADALRAANMNPHETWAAMAMGAMRALAMMYEQRDRPDVEHG